MSGLDAARLAERVRASHVVHTDDTPVQVLDPALPKTCTGRFWVSVGDEQNPYAVYDYTASRKRVSVARSTPWRG